MIAEIICLWQFRHVCIWMGCLPPHLGQVINLERKLCSKILHRKLHISEQTSWCNTVACTMYKLFRNVGYFKNIAFSWAVKTVQGLHLLPVWLPFLLPWRFLCYSRQLGFSCPGSALPASWIYYWSYHAKHCASLKSASEFLLLGWILKAQIKGFIFKSETGIYISIHRKKF